MTFIPIYIPSGNHEPDLCPNCHKEEKIKEVCVHCGYEYKEEDDKFFSIYIIGVLVTFLLSLIFIKLVPKEFICFRGLSSQPECSITEYSFMVFAALASSFVWPLTVPIVAIAFILSIL